MTEEERRRKYRYLIRRFMGGDASMSCDCTEILRRLNELDQEIDNLMAAVGTPLMANTAADMTDTDKIYVYVGSETGYTYGNWYFYDGSAWVSGGVYNSLALETDKTLSITDKAADAKVTGDRIDDLKSATDELKNDLGFNQTVELEHPDSSAHSLLNTSYRRFWEETIPAGARIDRVEIPIGAVGSGTPWINIEVWEQIDSATLQKAKTVPVPIVANTTVTVYIDYTSQHPCRIAQYGSAGNVQYYYISGATGQKWYISRDSVQSTETILLSSLGAYNNMYLVGDIFYTIIDATYKTQIPLSWKHGTFENGNGNIYVSINPAITDGKISTNVADYVELKSSRYSARIGYYNANGTYATYQTLAVNSPMQINKQYALFVLSLFIDWNTQVSLDDCNTDIICYTSKSVKESAETAILSFAEASANRMRNSVQSKRFNLDFISISHQGFSFTDIPNRNKVEGYKNAAERGFDYGETDVKITSDGVIVCCHDATFDDATTGDTVVIADNTLAQLQSHDYYGGTIATFDEVCKTCKQNGIGLVIDQTTAPAVSGIADVLTKYSMWGMAKWMLTYRPEYPNLAKEVSDAITAIYADANFIIDIEYDADNNYTNAIAYTKSLKSSNNSVWVHVPYLQDTTAQIADIMANVGAGYGISVYTIDSLNKCKEYMPYVTGIISNQFSTIDIVGA